MARPLRVELADGVCHVSSRGVERREIVCDDRHRRKWLELLGAVAITNGLKMGASATARGERKTA
jgi:hypothetical protein